jgi:restriction system protein
MERDQKTRYREAREQETTLLNEDIQDKLTALDRILPDTLSVNDTISFAGLRILDAPPPFAPPEHLKHPRAAPQEATYLGGVPVPGGLKAYMPGAKKRYDSAVMEAWKSYEADLAEWRKQEAQRTRELRALQERYARAVNAFEAKKTQRNAEVDAFESEYKAGRLDAVIAYCSMVLERSSYPDGCPQNFSVAYTAASKQLVVEYELPTVSVVPQIEEYRYVQARDAIASKTRKDGEIKDIYQDAIASIALRTIHEIFEADQGAHIDTVCFNGYIRTIDPATGHDIQPHLISVRATKERFAEIDLGRVDKRICLKNLGAQVSRRPEEAQPVKPIVEFNMADARFVDQRDLVSGLSSATNLMDLNPYEFEQLVANLFGQMGLDSRLTRSSRDGGVDCVAYDPRPVLGGKVVIQAKRYRDTVGVSAVRDLFGTMNHEGANKGILVTTSGYGPDAFDFAKDKPIELIDGGGLLFLLQEVGVQARIVFPEERP